MEKAGTPFRRATAMMAALAKISSMPQHMQIAARQQLGEYKSRGKGLGKHSGAKRGNYHSPKYAAQALVGNQPREVARRMRQIASGMLQVSI